MLTSHNSSGWLKSVRCVIDPAHVVTAASLRATSRRPTRGRPGRRHRLSASSIGAEANRIGSYSGQRAVRHRLVDSPFPACPPRRRSDGTGQGQELLRRRGSTSGSAHARCLHRRGPGPSPAAGRTSRNGTGCLRSPTRGADYAPLAGGAGSPSPIPASTLMSLKSLSSGFGKCSRATTPAASEATPRPAREVLRRASLSASAVSRAPEDGLRIAQCGC